MADTPATPRAARRPAQADLREDALTTVTMEGLAFFERYRTQVIAGVIALAVLVVGAIAYTLWQSNRADRAAELLGSALNPYQASQWQAALDGADGAPGLLAIADDYGRTPSGRQATLLAGDALFQLGRDDEALARFEAYRGDGLFAAGALAGQAAVFERRGEHAQAAELYERAAREDGTPAAAPGYLLDAARAHLAAGDGAAAQAALQTLLDEYRTAPEVQTARVEMGRAVAMASATGTPTGDVTAAPADTTAAAATPAGAPGAGVPVEIVP